ncbi:hypothetical protein P9112_004043 [Eukaryota sp. TZLM1-RC]
MSKSFKIASYLEPLLCRLVDEDTLNSFGRNRADLMLEGLEGTTINTDVRSTDVCNDFSIPMAQSKLRTPYLFPEKSKIDKYKAKLLSLYAKSHTHFVLCPSAVSLHGSLGPLALSFLDDFVETVKQRTGRVFGKTELYFQFSKVLFPYYLQLCYLLDAFMKEKLPVNSSWLIWVMKT